MATNWKTNRPRKAPELRRSTCRHCGNPVDVIAHPDLRWDVALEAEPPAPEVDIEHPPLMWKTWLNHGEGMGWAPHPMANRTDSREIRLPHKCKEK